MISTPLLPKFSEYAGKDANKLIRFTIQLADPRLAIVVGCLTQEAEPEA